MVTNNKLTRYQKEAIGLLSIGTFLEYFDLMLYVHMATLLNDLFFPKADPVTAQLFTAFAFCSTYLLRPIGGIVMGRLGDSYGRKATVIITSIIMAVACVIMATLPTYSEIGVTASIVMIICRMFQGFSSLGEIVGAELYLSEILKNPYKCMFSGMIGVSSKIGGFFALAIASYAISIGLNWRIAFLVGAIIAIVGIRARMKLRETPEFADYKRRLIKKDISIKSKVNQYGNEKIDKKFVLAYFFSEFNSPFCFYFAYILLGDYMKKVLGLSSEQVIGQNLKVSIIVAVGAFFIALLAKKIHPVKTAICGVIIFSTILLFIPRWLSGSLDLWFILFLQCAAFSLSVPASGTLDAIQYRYFPVGKRFSSLAIIFGIANPLAYTLVSFGSVPLIYYFGYYGLWILFVPVIIGFLWGLSYTRKLEIKTGRYHNYPHEDFPHEDTAGKEDKYEYKNLEDEYEPFSHRCEHSINLMNKLDEFSKRDNRKLNMKLIEKSITFAKRWHGIQMRKTGDHPFYWHPLKVAEMVAERYCKTDMIVAAILHDVVEDSKCTVELVEKEFNVRIAQMVDRLTKNRFENGENMK